MSILLKRSLIPDNIGEIQNKFQKNDNTITQLKKIIDKNKYKKEWENEIKKNFISIKDKNLFYFYYDDIFISSLDACKRGVLTFDKMCPSNIFFENTNWAKSCVNNPTLFQKNYLYQFDNFKNLMGNYLPIPSSYFESKNLLKTKELLLKLRSINDIVLLQKPVQNLSNINNEYCEIRAVVLTDEIFFSEGQNKNLFTSQDEDLMIDMRSINICKYNWCDNYEDTTILNNNYFRSSKNKIGSSYVLWVPEDVYGAVFNDNLDQ